MRARRTILLIFGQALLVSCVFGEDRGIEGAVTVTPSEGPQKYAVIVGVNGYDDPGIGDLQFAVADAQAVHSALTSAPNGFDVNRSVLLTDDMPPNRQPTRSNVLKFLQAFLGLAGPEDTVLVYFAGHGTMDRNPTSSEEELHLLPSDASLSLIGETSVPYRTVKGMLAECAAKCKVLILDACHSAAGRALTRMPRGIESHLRLAGEGTVVLASSGADEVSHEMPETGHGAFTYFLLQGLQGEADSNNDGLIDAEELSGYAWNRTSLWAADQGFSQKPWKLASVSGKIMLAGVHAPGMRIARCNCKRVFDNYRKVKDGIADLEAYRAPLQTELDRLSREIEAQKTRYDNDGSLTAREKKSLEKKIRSRYAQYQEAFEKAQSDIDARHARLVAEARADIHVAAQTVARRNGYDMVIDSDPKATEKILWVREGLVAPETVPTGGNDISQEVIGEVNSQ